jgi:hypothetical protein
MRYRSLQVQPRWAALIAGSTIVAIFTYLFDPPTWFARQVPGTVISNYSSLNTRSTRNQWLVRLPNGGEILAVSQRSPKATFLAGAQVRVTAF